MKFTENALQCIKDRDLSPDDCVELTGDQLDDELREHHMEVEDDDYEWFLYHELEVWRLKNGNLLILAKRLQKLLNGDLEFESVLCF